MYDIIVYYEVPYKIGGIETFIYQLGKKFKDKDITFMYGHCDTPEQLERYKTVYKNVIQYNGEKIQCNKLIINAVVDFWILPFIEAKEYIRIVHGDYFSAKEPQPLPENLEKIFCRGTVIPYNFNKPIKYYGVSKRACIAFYRLTGKKVELCYNPLELDHEPQKVLHLISTTRMSPEKGSIRMIQLAQMFEDANIPYIWTVFGDDELDIGNLNFTFIKPRLDIIDYIADADYLVQLSDHEGMPYVLFEALSVGTPVIATKFYAAQELRIDEGKGFLLDFDMSNVDVQAIYNQKFDFTWEPPKNIWERIING